MRKEFMIILLKNILKGKIVVEELDINQYIQETLCCRDKRIQSASIIINDNLIKMKTIIKPVRFAPVIRVNLPMELYDWSFDRDIHILQFKLSDNPEYRIDGRISSYLSLPFNYIMKKIFGFRVFGFIAAKVDYLEFADRILTLNLDKYPDIKDIINKEYSFLNTTIRPFDLFGINDILLDKGMVIIIPMLNEQIFSDTAETASYIDV